MGSVETALKRYDRSEGVRRMAALDWSQCPVVESFPGKVSGAWVLRGTRMPVATIFENLEAGANIDDIMEWFDGLDRQQVKAVIELPPAVSIRQHQCPTIDVRPVGPPLLLQVEHFLHHGEALAVLMVGDGFEHSAHQHLPALVDRVIVQLGPCFFPTSFNLASSSGHTSRCSR